jgi:hypothetical protein
MVGLAYVLYPCQFHKKNAQEQRIVGAHEQTEFNIDQPDLAIEATPIIPARSRLCSWIEAIVSALRLAKNVESMEMEGVGICDM